jgi:aldehyde dehydrogenase (NAD+)
MVSQNDVAVLLERQRIFFSSGKTLPLSFRLAQLKKLKEAIKKNESDLIAALASDLGKSEFEAFTAEIGFLYEEINITLKNLQKWVKPKRVFTPILMQPGSSRILTEPKGVVLIIAPWNYPIQLTLAPMVAAIAAGNCLVVKPSELAPASTAAVKRLLEQCFSPEFCCVVTGGVDETTNLLTHRFDHIFFTGSSAVGKVVMRAAADHLTPVTLELGGKSPCVVDRDVDLETVARRIVWGKFYNAGQSCVAPDYVLVHRSSKPSLLSFMKKAIHEFYGQNPAQSPDFGRIIGQRHFDRLVSLIHGKNVFTGGTWDRETRYIAPTILDKVALTDPIMENEIFGPILPILDYEHLDDAIAIVKKHSHPLACYVFTSNPKIESRILREIPFGGGSVNSALMHLLNPRMPFGGIGASGMGSYHGKAGVEAFSHKKSIYKSPLWLDIPLKYPPYEKRLPLMRRLMR